jgi:hypothetical protein
MPAAPCKLPSLSTVYLDRIGLNAAIVLKYLCKLQTKATITRHGKRWFFSPIGGYQVSGKKSKSPNYRPIARHFPWLKKSALYKIISQLNELKLVEITRKQNKLKSDRTLWYHVPNSVLQLHRDKTRWLYFEPTHALKFGIGAAVVMNIFYREFQVVKSERISLSYYRMSKKSSLTQDSCKHAVNKLIDANMIHRYCNQYETSYSLMGDNPLEGKIGDNQELPSLAKEAPGIVRIEIEELARVEQAFTLHNTKVDTTIPARQDPEHLASLVDQAKRVLDQISAAVKKQPNTS